LDCFYINIPITNNSGGDLTTGAATINQFKDDTTCTVVGPAGVGGSGNVIHDGETFGFKLNPVPCLYIPSDTGSGCGFGLSQALASGVTSISFSVNLGAFTIISSDYTILGFGGDIVLNSPNLGQTTPDFKNWGVTVSFDGTQDNDWYYVLISYGGSSGIYSYQDSSQGQIGNEPAMQGLSFSKYERIQQLANAGVVPSGVNYVTAELYDENDNLLAYTPEISFTIVSGAEIDIATSTDDNTSVEDAIARCQSSGGIISDIGATVCKLVVTLFYPETPLSQRISDMQALAITKAPFSYFYQGYTIITGLSGTTGTVPTLTYTLSVVSANDLSVTMFSPTTISTYAGAGGVATFRALAEVALYLAFIVFVIYEARKLFNPHQH